MKLLNIRDVDDSFERYRMPALESRIKHQGQYHQTYLVNLPDVAKALKIDLTCLVKYFGWEFSTQSKFNEDNGEVALKGTFDEAVLLTALRKFINQYVLCQECSLPELDYVAKKKKVGDKCRACGHRSLHDTNDRVYKILYQSLQDNGKNKKSAKKIGPSPSLAAAEFGFDPEDLELAEDDVGWSVDTSAEAAAARKQDAIGESKVLDKLLG